MARFRARFAPLLVAAIASFAGIAHGRPVNVASDTSAADAIAHVEAWIKNHPKDAAGYRVLAHIHALAWAYGEKIPLVGTLSRDSLPLFTEDATILVSRTAPRERLWESKAIPPGNRPERPVTADDSKHLAASIAAYRKAIELDADDALSELGLGWMLTQQGTYTRDLPAEYFGELKPTAEEKATWTQAINQLADDNPKVRDTASKTLLAAMPKCAVVLRDVKSDDPETKTRIDFVLNGYCALQALAHYRKAYELRANVDLKGEPTYQVDSQVSAKAGAQILTVLAQHPDAAKKGETKDVEDVIAPLAEKRKNLMMRPQ